MRYLFFSLCALVLLAGAPAAVWAAPAPSGSFPTDARFAALDGNGDGRVTWEEFHNANESIARQGFDIIDTDKNGEITLDEWRAFSANHGMDIAMPPASSTLPARPAEAPNTPGAPSPGKPSLPLVMPPAETDASRPGVSPVLPDEPSLPSIPPGTGALPLIMPPAGNSATIPTVTPPPAPTPPALPLLTPPTPPVPAAGTSTEVR